jgi:hypothetical protein
MALIHAIENLLEPDFSAVEKHNRPYDKPWSGLGGFGHMCSDVYQSSSWKTNAEVAKGLERDKLRHKHIRIAEIETTMVVAGLGGLPIDWGYETVVNILESSNALLDFELPAAAQWIIICGKRFRQRAEKGEESWVFKRRVIKSAGLLLQDLGTAPLDQVMSSEPGAFGDTATIALGAMRKEESAPS